MPRTTPAVLLTNHDPQLASWLRQLLHSQGLHCVVLERPEDCSHAPLCRWLQDRALPAHAALHASLADAIEVLERSRHAFKSRELAALRRRLQQTLVALPSSVEG